MKSINLKIGRYEYEITDKDKFMDNGHCIQLLSQKKQWNRWRYVTPKLSQKAIIKISKFKRIPVASEFTNVQVFRLKLEK